MTYIVLCLAIVAVCIRPLGYYMASVFKGRPVWLKKYIGGFERFIYSICGIDSQKEYDWRGYAAVILMLGLFGFLFLFGLFVGQAYLPLNPQGVAGMPFDVAFNAAISFVTNTNWQSYSGEIALSYLSQSAGCAVQNFLSAATGMVVAVALFRGLGRKQTKMLGNPFVDMVRAVLYILLPASLVFSVFLLSQGVVQTYGSSVVYTTVESSAPAQIAVGPVASQVAIKMLGSNGGGFFNANGAHPFENPTPLSNLVQLISILLIPAAFAYSFGVIAGDRRQGWVVIATMSIILIPLLAATITSEHITNPRFDTKNIDVSAGNMEGKETRFGVTSSALWAVATTATSNGSVNAMHDSLMPLAGIIPLLMIQLGEVVFGGVGSGMYGMLMFVLLTVFIGGLMVGRTPEYMGKKLGVFEIKMASLVLLIPAILVLLGTALAVMTEAGRAGIQNPGAQGFSEILYAYSSAANNNGSAFAGLTASSPFYNISLGIVMLLGRYLLIIPVLAIAGSLAEKNTVPFSAGTLPTHTPIFTSMLVGIIILIGVLTYVPALALGPVAEHLHLFRLEGK
jgi:potassium-transporting ATPase potassium-binding subunit